MKVSFLKILNMGIALLIGFVSSVAHAGLIDRGNGLIYDEVQDITWLQDANYAKTSGYAYEGNMNWNEAITWADELVYGGYDDWRLFNASPDDINCSESSTFHGTTKYGFNCTESELGHLFYNEFGLTQEQSILEAAGDADFDLFINVADYAYWSGTESSPLGPYALNFATSSGYQAIARKRGGVSGWAVRDGDVSHDNVEIPEPSTFFVFSLGLMGLVSSRLKKNPNNISN